MAEKGEGRRAGCGVLLGVTLLVLVGSTCFGDDGTSTAPSTRRGSGYLAEYGGQQQVYDRIARLTDCFALQEQFDLAANNNDRATPGSAEHRWTLGYMTAADERLEAVGCYG